MRASSAKRVPSTSSIRSIRRRIDRVDRKIVALIAGRISLIDKLLPLKKNVSDPKRARRVLDNVTGFAKEFKTDADVVACVYRRLLEQTLKYQSRKRVGSY